MSLWSHSIYMVGVELGKWLELLRANSDRFEINMLLFADDTAGE